MAISRIIHYSNHKKSEPEKNIYCRFNQLVGAWPKTSTTYNRGELTEDRDSWSVGHRPQLTAKRTSLAALSVVR